MTTKKLAAEVQASEEKTGETSKVIAVNLSIQLAVYNTKGEVKDIKASKPITVCEAEFPEGLMELLQRKGLDLTGQ